MWINKYFAIIYAYYLLWKYNLYKKNWTFSFDNAHCSGGQTWVHQKKITLSKKYVERVNISDIKDTLIHEIAHALVDPKSNHNDIWRNKFISIGGSGRIYCKCFEKLSDFKWKYSCKKCDLSQGYCYRKYKIWCYHCGNYLYYVPNDN